MDASRQVGELTEATLSDMGFELVINCTWASLQGLMPPVPSTVFAPQCAAYDMVYTPNGSTPFLDKARACGAAITSDGLGMLVEQAAESFFIWRGVRPDTRPVLEMLRAPPS